MGNKKIRIIVLEIKINLGNASVVLRSQTTLFASTFHAFIPPSAVPMRSFIEYYY